MLGGLLVKRVKRPFVDLTRYLDTSPPSYEARRAIRGGLVDLLRDLHNRGYSRIVVVGHSVGTVIAYDALMSFWAENHRLHAAAPNARAEVADDDAAAALDGFQERQLALW